MTILVPFVLACQIQIHMYITGDYFQKPIGIGLCLIHFFGFPDRNFTLDWNIKSKFHMYITGDYLQKPIDIELCLIQNGRLAATYYFGVSGP